jgi:hypothetical protein
MILNAIDVPILHKNKNIGTYSGNELKHKYSAAPEAARI